MGRFLVKEFNPNKPVFARKKFKAAGRSFNPGDELDWRKMAVNSRRVRQMYDVGLVWHGDEKPTAATVRAQKMAETSARRDADIANNLKEESKQDEKLTVNVMIKDEKIAELSSEDFPLESYPKHAGGPWYELSNGERVRGKDKADEMQAEL